LEPKNNSDDINKTRYSKTEIVLPIVKYFSIFCFGLSQGVKHTKNSTPDSDDQTNNNPFQEIADHSGGIKGYKSCIEAIGGKKNE